MPGCGRVAAAAGVRVSAVASACERGVPRGRCAFCNQTEIVDESGWMPPGADPVASSLCVFGRQQAQPVSFVLRTDRGVHACAVNALQELSKDWNGASLLGWAPGVDVCTWNGVTCSGDAVVSLYGRTPPTPPCEEHRNCRPCCQLLSVVHRPAGRRPFAGQAVAVGWPSLAARSLARSLTCVVVVVVCTQEPHQCGHRREAAGAVHRRPPQPRNLVRLAHSLPSSPQPHM